MGGSLMSAVMGQSEARKQRSFIREMENTRYQRTMTDMKAAGLNPLLAYKQGAGSTSPGGIAQVPDFGASFSKGVSAAASAKDVQQKGPVAKAQAALIKEQTNAATWQAAANRNYSHLLDAQALLEWDKTIASGLRKHVDMSTYGRTAIQVGRRAELGAAPIGHAVGALSPFRMKGVK